MEQQCRIAFPLLVLAPALLFAEGSFAGEGSPGKKEAPPPGPEIYVAHDQILAIDATSRKILATIPIDEVVNGIAFSPDGTRAFVGTSGAKDLAKSRGGLLVLDTESRRVVAKVTQDPVKEVHAHPGGKRLYFLDWKVRDEPRPGGKKKPVKEQFRLQTFDISGPEPRSMGSAAAGMDLYDFAVSPDEKTAYLLDPGHNQLRIMDLPSGHFAEVLDLSGGSKADGTRHDASSAKIVLDGKGERAAVLLDGQARTGALLIDLDRRTRKPVIVQNGSRLRAGRFAPDGKRLIALALERILLLDIEAGKLLRTVPLRETFTSLAASPDGSEIYLGAPVALKTREALGGGLVEVRTGDEFAVLAQIGTPITVKFLVLTPPRKPVER